MRMRSQLSKLYHQQRMYLKNCINYWIRFIRNKDDDHHFNNPFVIN